MSLAKLSVSKWLKSQVLLDALEMEECFAAIGHFEFYNTSSMASFEELTISRELFLKEYRSYVEALQSGTLAEPNRKIFSAVATVDRAAVVLSEVRLGKWMAKLAAPLIQLQHHRFFISKVDHKIHSMVMSPDSLYWGMQFSWPQIFLGAAGTYTKTSHFPNGTLFSKLQKWLREYSVPTTFIFDGVKTGTSIRLGKRCFEWIHHHPQLKASNIQIQHN